MPAEQLTNIPTPYTIAGATTHPSGEIWLTSDADAVEAELWSYTVGAEPVLLLTLGDVPFAGWAFRGPTRMPVAWG